MRAAVIKEYGKIEPMELTVPEIKNNQVLVKVSHASICGSDQHIFKGEFHPRTRLPLVPGHEFAGVIEKTGSEVVDLSPGDKVTVDPIIWCGQCAACRAGHYPACTSLKLIGIDMDGGFAEYVVADADKIYSIPDHIPGEHAALVEVLSIGFHAASRAEVGPADDIAIWGAGKVGHSILQAVKTITTGKVFMVDILQERLDLVKTGYPDVMLINARKKDPVEVIKEYTSGRGVDIAFEAVGHAAKLEGYNPVRSCINAIRGAGKVCVLGLSDEPAEILMKELIWKEARIIASRVSHGEFAAAIDALSRGLLRPEIMITDVLPLGEASKGFELLEKDPARHLKILLEI
ncbi:MAG TPA: alcohol dehydrogenase catalytic domain-containing protein [Bacteroidales bacterium]|nr:alcohol dehydrogenase catalytic domain-containing protein [Bacteroidales bacterium]